MLLYSYNIQHNNIIINIFFYWYIKKIKYQIYDLIFFIFCTLYIKSWLNETSGNYLLSNLIFSLILKHSGFILIYSFQDNYPYLAELQLKVYCIVCTWIYFQNYLPLILLPRRTYNKSRNCCISFHVGHLRFFLYKYSFYYQIVIYTNINRLIYIKM